MHGMVGLDSLVCTLSVCALQLSTKVSSNELMYEGRRASLFLTRVVVLYYSYFLLHRLLLEP